jgi:hypothetical protein
MTARLEISRFALTLTLTRSVPIDAVWFSFDYFHAATPKGSLVSGAGWQWSTDRGRAANSIATALRENEPPSARAQRNAESRPHGARQMRRTKTDTKFSCLQTLEIPQNRETFSVPAWSLKPRSA